MSSNLNAKKVKESKKDDGSSGEDSGGKGQGDAAKGEKGKRRRKDGTENKMSFDVDELEDGLYIQVEDEEDVEEIVEYEEVPDDEAGVPETSQDGAKAEDLKETGKSKATSAEDSTGYKIRPDLVEKFRPGSVQMLIERVIKDKLEGKEYSGEECDGWVQQILDEIHDKVKCQNYKRYKLISQITLGERRGEGASSATRCIWDAEADCMATYTFLNASKKICSQIVVYIWEYYADRAPLDMGLFERPFVMLCHSSRSFFFCGNESGWRKG